MCIYTHHLSRDQIPGMPRALVVEKLRTREEKSIFSFPFHLGNVQDALECEAAPHGAPSGQGEVPTHSDSCLISRRRFLSCSVISERFDAGAGRGSPKQVRRLTRGQKRKRVEGRGPKKAGGELRVQLAHQRSSHPVGGVTGVLPFLGGHSFGRGTRRARPTGVGGRCPGRLACFWSPFGGGGEGTKGPALGPRFLVSRCVDRGPGEQTCIQGSNMGGQIEFSMRRFQMNPDVPVTRDSRSCKRKCICHLCNLLHTRQDRLTD